MDQPEPNNRTAKSKVEKRPLSGLFGPTSGSSGQHVIANRFAHTTEKNLIDFIGKSYRIFQTGWCQTSQKTR